MSGSHGDSARFFVEDARIVRTTGLCSSTWWSGNPADPTLVRAMASRAPYRARTGFSLEVSGPTCLAHLGVPERPEDGRIADVLPAIPESRGVLLGFHGRLDNRKELFETVGLGGVSSAKEVSDALLAKLVYHHCGLAMPGRLLGDFALVLWDPKRKRLLAARDPMAMKPLYLAHDRTRTLVASEIRQIMAAGDLPRRIWEPAICAYLGGGEVPTHRTFYDGVTQVSPGCAVVVEDGRERVERFSEILSDLPETPSGNEIGERFRESFRTAVRRRLRGKRSVGVSLSGGLDSGSVASMLGVLRREGRVSVDVHAYTWAFPTLPECDERDVSDIIVDHFGFSHRDLDAEDAHPLSGFPDHGPHEDDPLIFPYQPILERTFAAAACDGVEVLMSGDRGDLLAGDYVYDLSRELLSGHPLRALRGLEVLRSRHGRGWLNGAWRYLVRPTLSRGRAAVRRARRTESRWSPRANQARWPDWVRTDFLERVGPPAPDPDPTGLEWLGPARRRRVRSIFTNLQMRGMVLTERSHAAQGIDFADPWSDLELARLCIAADQNLLNHPDEEKRMVRSAMKGVIPEAARTACRKTVPLPLFYKALRTWRTETVRCLIEKPRVAEMGFVDRDVLSQRYEAFVSGSELRPEFWWTLSLEMWLRRYW